MNQRLQFAEALRIVKNNPAERFPVNAPIRLDNLRAEFPDHRIISRSAGFNDLMGQFIGAKDLQAAFAE